MNTQNFLCFKFKLLQSQIKLVKEQSTLKIIVISSFVLGYLIFSFFCFHQMFNFMQQFPIVGALLMQRTFFVYFFILSIMLTLSAFVLSLSSIFNSPETEYLLTSPIKIENSYLMKFTDILFLSAWAFITLSLPIFAAFAWLHEINPIFFLFQSMVVILPFITITASVGIIIAIVSTRYLFNPVGKTFIAVFLSIVVFYLWQKIPEKGTFRTTNIELMFNNLLSFTKVTTLKWFPSTWVSDLFINLTLFKGKSVWPLIQLLFSSAVCCLFVMHKLASIIGFDAWSIYKSGTSTKSRLSLFNFLQKKLFHTKLKINPFMLKDIQLFLRDPVQSLQFLFFFGILFFYIANIKNLNFNIEEPFWINLIGHLNIGSVSLIWATLSTRFFFPQVSLEGKCFWIIKLSPININSIIKNKMSYFCISGWFLTLPIIWTSNQSLQVQGVTFWVSIWVIFLSCYFLTVLSISLGCIFPDFESQNSAAIVSGFGGTLNLVLSIVFVFFSTAVPAIIGHLKNISVIDKSNFLQYLIIYETIFSIITIFLSIILFRIGTKRLNEMSL